MRKFLALAAALSIVAAAYWGVGAWRRHALATMPLDRVEAQLLAGELAQAEAALAARLERDPGDRRARLLFARARRAAGDPDGAAAAVRRIPAESHYYVDGQLLLAMLFYDRGEAGRAKPALRAGVAAAMPGTPAWTEAANALAAILDHQGRDEELAQLHRALLPYLDAEGQARALDGNVRQGLYRRPAAPREAALRRYLEADPADDDSRAALALALVEDARTAEAAALLAPLFREGAKPPAPPVWRVWTRVLFDAQRFEELLAALDKLPGSANDQAWYWHYRAEALARRGAHADAYAAIKKGVALAPRARALVLTSSRLAHRVGDSAAGKQYADVAQALEDAENELRGAFDAWLMSIPQDRAACARRMAAALAGAGRDSDAERYRELAERFAAAAPAPATVPLP